MEPSVWESPRKLTAKAVYSILICSLPILITFAIFGKVWIGFGTWICFVTVMFVVRIRWDLRRYFWFWTTVAFAGLLQIPIVLLIPWGNSNLTRITFFPVGVFDFLTVYGCIGLAERMQRRSKGPGG
jgi:hypothetical protein